MFTIAQKDHPIRGTATSILLEVQNPYGVSTRFDELADLHLLVSEVLLAISAIVGDSVTLLEAAGGYSCRTTSSSEVFTCSPPLYLMKPSFLNLFMKKFTRERVVPTISASVC